MQKETIETLWGNCSKLCFSTCRELGDYRDLKVVKIPLTATQHFLETGGQKYLKTLGVQLWV